MGLALGPILFCVQAWTAEVDNFTQRYEGMHDSAPVVDEYINWILKTAARQTANCDEADLVSRLEHELADGWLESASQIYAKKSKRIDKRSIALKYSIYGYLPYSEIPKSLYDSIVLHTARLQPIIRLGSYIVGVDKLGHFFTQGLRMERDFKTARESLDWSIATERTYFGGWTTGVVSYADVAANFAGMRFWRQMKQGHIQNFYACEEGRFRLRKPFQILRYVDHAWDEAINCNEYPSADFRLRVSRNIAKLEAKTGVKFQCPVLPNACEELNLRYGSLARDLLGPGCRKMNTEVSHDRR